MIDLKCGDCLELMKDIPDNSVDMILSAPPYGMNFKSGHRKQEYDLILNDNNLLFLDDFFKESYRILKNNSAIYIFCSWHNIDIFKSTFDKYFNLKNILIWEKNNTSMGDLKGAYAPKYEMILYGVKGKCLLNGKRYSDIVYANRTGNKLHPTQKPVDLLCFLLRNSSKKGDTVFDGFMGSGSTGVACVIEKRNFIGIELDNHYFNVAKDRIHQEETKKRLF